MNETKGEIVKTKDGYSVEAISIYVLRYFRIKPQPITFSDKGDWTRHDCCICGTSFKPYTPQPVIEHQETTYNICDICLERECPELYTELKKRQAKFDKQYIQDKK